MARNAMSVLPVPFFPHLHPSGGYCHVHKPEFAAFVLEQLGGERRGVTCRKMFGEYGLHCYGKFFALICDDVFYFKPTPAGERLLTARGRLVTGSAL